MLKMGGVAGELLPVRKGVGDIHIGPADILLHIAVHLGHVHRNLPKPVIFVPAEEQAGLLAHLPQRLYHKIAGGHIPEVADVDSAGRTNARGTDVLLFLRAAPDDLLRDFFRPMH